MKTIALCIAMSLAAGGFATAALSSSTATRVVDISKASKIVIKQETVYISDADPHRCILVAFAQFPAVSGATQYAVVAKGLAPSHDVNGGGPPFQYDHYVTSLGGGKTVVFDAPSGAHWFPVHSSSSGTACAGDAAAYATSHFSIASATATVTGAATTTTTTPRKSPLPSRGGKKRTVYVGIPIGGSLRVRWTGPDPIILERKTYDTRFTRIDEDGGVRNAVYRRSDQHWSKVSIATGPKTTLVVYRDDGKVALRVKPNAVTTFLRAPNTNLSNYRQPTFTNHAGFPLEHQ